jgi:superfamily II DNA or RNA helicase
MFEEYTDDL